MRIAFLFSHERISKAYTVSITDDFTNVNGLRGATLSVPDSYFSSLLYRCFVFACQTNKNILYLLINTNRDDWNDRDASE